MNRKCGRAMATWRRQAWPATSTPTCSLEWPTRRALCLAAPGASGGRSGRRRAEHGGDHHQRRQSRTGLRRRRTNKAQLIDPRQQQQGAEPFGAGLVASTILQYRPAVLVHHHRSRGPDPRDPHPVVALIGAGGLHVGIGFGPVQQFDAAVAIDRLHEGVGDADGDIEIGSDRRGPWRG